MANVLTPSQQNLLAASAGNAALLELLQSLFNTVGAVQQATNTTGKDVPAQATAAVSYLEGSYVVQITNPGQSSPLSQLQSAQQTQGASQATTIQNVTAILHQIRCATSPSFAVNDNVQVFGGNSGSTQTYWTLTGLGSGNFYFQIRSSYDGINFNQWKNANGGQTVTSFPEEVTIEQETNADWAVLTLPGQQLIAVGEGFVPDQGTFGLPQNLYSSAMLAIAGPNGVIQGGLSASDIAQCEVAIDVPSDTSGTVGIPDYPVIVKMKYGDQSTPNQTLWSGNANIFGICYDPAGKNVTTYLDPASKGIWAVFTLPGGAQIAIGQGMDQNGNNIFVPSQCPWITPATMISICSIQGIQAPHAAHGIGSCGLSGITIEATYKDNSGNTWPGNANWLAVAWTPGAATYVSGGATWVLIQLAGGNVVAFGAGVTAPAAGFDLPPNFNAEQMVAIATPASFVEAGHVMTGVGQCDIVTGIGAPQPVLAYIDGEGNQWSGDSNWFAFAWVSL